MNPTVATRLTAAALLAAALTGCGPYTLRGLVVDGPDPGAWVVSPDDPRLESVGVPDASITLVLDPRSLGRKELGRFLSDSEGRIAIPVDVLGAGFLEEDFGLVVRRAGFQTLDETIRLPSGDNRLLVVLKRGPDTYRPPTDPFREARPYLNQ